MRTAPWTIIYYSVYRTSNDLVSYETVRPNIYSQLGIFITPRV